MDLDGFLSSAGWTVVHRRSMPPRSQELFDVSDLALSSSSEGYLRSAFPNGIFFHQKKAISEFIKGNNICLTTGTASGKSLTFYISAMEKIAEDPNCCIVAIYPLKALGREQEERWKKAFAGTGLADKIVRLDGQIPVASRSALLKGAKVLIATPDIIHAWVLSNLSDKNVFTFFRNISLVIVDEVHTYTGVFGSNAAFLFRRIQHVLSLLGVIPRYVCASATIASPETHLRNLLGSDFCLVGPEFDSSPKYKIEVHLVNPPRTLDTLTQVSNLLYYLTSRSSSGFMAFVDSRKQTEQVSSILARYQEDSDEQVEHSIGDRLRRLNVLPFRAGYEEHDRDLIQERLSRGDLKGVVCTSALELGIDIPFFDTGVLIGVPRSSTSLMQRIGRIGRHCNGTVMVVNMGEVYDEAIFKNPEELFVRPPIESALYLENVRIQYIHAMCLARHGGEHDQVSSVYDQSLGSQFTSSVQWPPGFIDLCDSEIRGEIPVDLQSMKSEAGDDPNHVYPLRDVESQFHVELKQGPEVRSLGSLSHGQLMREAYPAAVYYYTTQPFRVYRVSVPSKTVQVRKEKRYTTRPQMLPALVFPNLTSGNIHQCKTYGDMIVIESNLQIRESISGVKERRGPNESSISYPLDSTQTGVFFSQPLFTRNYFTTGVTITHQSLNTLGVSPEKISEILYEVLLVVIPFERRDLNFSGDKHRSERGPIHEGNRFISIFDQTYGSLRLSGCLLDDNVLRTILSKAVEWASQPEIVAISAEDRNALGAMYQDALKPGSNFGLECKENAQLTGRSVRIISPGSRGLDVMCGNEEYEVEAFFFSPDLGGWAYRGRRVSRTDRTVSDIVPIANIVEIPGESTMAIYKYETGEIEPE